MQRVELIGLLARLLKVDVARVSENARLMDLVVDSFVLIETIVELQDELDIILVQEDMEDIIFIRQFLDVCERKLARQNIVTQ